MKREQWTDLDRCRHRFDFRHGGDRLPRWYKNCQFQRPSDADAASRYQRGVNTFNAGKALAQARGWPFNWRPVELAGVGHDAKKMFAAPQASAALSP
jgi:hypothetical protein